MKRLRVRVELNRRKAGVPLDELVSVVDETRKFFYLLAEDVAIDPARGVWQASDFDPESLNFTAEFDGPASAQQIRDFGAAFGGSTSLRQETIAQFTHIADLIAEDELVGFGLFQSDQETEPSDWRCLSRRDALRFANEIQFLSKSVGESASSLPPVMNGSAVGRRLFKDRREREVLASEPSKWIREVESNLNKRIASLEAVIENQNRKLRVLGTTPEAGEERLRQLITALESVSNHAPRQLPPSVESGEEPRARVPNKKTLRLGWVSGFLLIAAAVALAGLASSEKAVQFLGLSIPLGLAHHATPPVAASPIAETKSVVDVPAPAPPQAAPQPPPPAPSPEAIPVKRSSPGPVDGTKAIRQIALEIPADLKSMIRSEALVNIAVTIDEQGKVADAKVTSTSGEGADLLSTEALKTARWFRFRPAREGKTPVRSETVLNFVFEPDSRP